MWILRLRQSLMPQLPIKVSATTSRLNHYKRMCNWPIRSQNIQRAQSEGSARCHICFVLLVIALHSYGNVLFGTVSLLFLAPPPVAYAPTMGLPNLLPPSPYVAPDPCNPCNTCAQCSLPVCSPCTQACHALTCPPRIPAKLQPLWQQWNERTAGNKESFCTEIQILIFLHIHKLLCTNNMRYLRSSH